MSFQWPDDLYVAGEIKWLHIDHKITLKIQKLKEKIRFLKTYKFYHLDKTTANILINNF